MRLRYTTKTDLTNKMVYESSDKTIINDKARE